MDTNNKPSSPNPPNPPNPNNTDKPNKPLKIIFNIPKSKTEIKEHKNISKRLSFPNNITLKCSSCKVSIDNFLIKHKIYDGKNFCNKCFELLLDNKQNNEDNDEEDNNEDNEDNILKCCDGDNTNTNLSFDDYFSSLINKLNSFESDNTTTNFEEFYSSILDKIKILESDNVTQVGRKKIDKNKNNKNNNKKTKFDNNNSVKHKNSNSNDYEYGYEDEDEDDSKLEYEWLGSDIKNIEDLIRIGKSYNSKKRKRHNLNLKNLNNLVEPLTELLNMIGMVDIKKIIFDQIIYYLQNLDDKNVDMLHTVIVGPPGVGKTQLTHIIAKIYNRLGFLKTDNVICAKRDDLVAEYVGQTAPKTRKVLEKALGGVLLLDEVYSLSPNSEKDFAKEAIDMINMYLSEHCHDLVCVIAGYKKPTYENFLTQNEGLARRFTHHYEIKGYNSEELTLIFKKYVEENKWSILCTNDLIIPIIEKNMKQFPNFGGDMTTLFSCCKKTHSKRLLLIPTEKELQDTKKKLSITDIETGINLFMDIKEKSKGDEDNKDIYVNMYS
jgi:hypothetical protein